MSNNITIRLQNTLQDISKRELSDKMIFSLVDLTLLKENASLKEINTLVTQAALNNTASVCVYPNDLAHIPQNLTRATVVNFPHGQTESSFVLNEIEEAITKYKADEIDYVFPYQAYLSGQKKQALDACFAAYQLCKRQKIIFKVILETGAWPSLELIYQVSVELINQGCDFIKTSTGKIATGATIPSEFAILAAIYDTKSTCGIKVSGGIRTWDVAREYIYLAESVLKTKVNSQWFRIGSSGLS